MAGSERGDDLRALAALYDEMGDLQDAAEAAKQAYRDDPNDETKAAHHAASEALNKARADIRSAPVLPAGEPGSTTVRVQPAGGKRVS